MASPSKKPEAHDTRAVSMPRAWLVALATLIVAPWIVVAVLYQAGSAGDRTEEAVVSAVGPAVTRDAGRWGELSVTPIVVSPPLEYVAIEDDPVTPPEWRFPGTSPEVLSAFLAASGMPAVTQDQVKQAARAEPRIAGLVVRPEAAVVGALPPEVRARLYTELAKTTYNPDQAHSFRFRGASTDAWLGGSLISTETRALVEPMIYRDGDYLHFADLDLVRAQLDDDDEERRLVKTLYRQSTVLVRLAVDDADRVDDLAEYWGRGGRRTDLRPLLESVAGAEREGWIDVVHLLPAFARDHLYRYPRLSTADFDKPVIANCLWTALNFFADVPDDRFLDVDTALDALRRDYFVVTSEFLLGDVVAFLDREGDLFHVAVYLADDLVFSKNGTSPMSPWTIMSIDELKGYYRSRSAEPRLIYHRRNGF